MSSASMPHSLLSVAAMVLAVIVGGCGPPQSDGPGPGDVGPQTAIGPVGGEDGIAGSENVTTEALVVDSFDRLVFASEGDVVLAPSSNPGLRITADDNLHQYLETVVADSTLTITTADGVDIAPSRPISFQIDATTLSTIELRGAGTITVNGRDFGVASIALSGAGDITIEDLKVQKVIVSHQGVGTIRLAGEVDAQEVSVSGVGEYEAGELVSRVAEIEASGTGEAIVWVTGELTCSASDSGVIRFYGDPFVEKTVLDSGSIVAMGAK